MEDPFLPEFIQYDDSIHSIQNLRTAKAQTPTVGQLIKCFHYLFLSIGFGAKGTKTKYERRQIQLLFYLFSSLLKEIIKSISSKSKTANNKQITKI
mmetsp:Transcript_11438/g.24136  ORF Transcript_11438/g.24136 Transcript_11438/m.24136 type:complete len:96 (-) Transcript_11438:372-659(-)